MRIAVALAAVLSLAGCGARTGADAPAAEEPSRRIDVVTSDTELTVVVRPGGGCGRQTSVLSCDPPDGDHPDPAGACRELAGMTKPFAPVPQGTACTEIYGGPQTAQVQGTYRGDPVDAEFSRSDGCQVARWDAHATLLLWTGEARGASVNE